MATAGERLGDAMKKALDDYIATLSDGEKRDFGDTQRTNMFQEWGEAINTFIVPVGGIIAWHKSLTGTPSLPGNFVECNGQTISDNDSPYDGATIPDLNGDARFLRGGSSSGTEQTDAFQNHWHRLKNKDAPNNDNYVPNRRSFTDDGTNQIIGWEELPNEGDEELWAVEPVENTDESTGAPRVDNETRPVNMSVVWIMRVK